MANHFKKSNPVLTSHVAFYFVGLSSMIIYPLLDLDTFIFLRYLGITIYDAESISFQLRRFNLFIGLFICTICMLAGQGAECSHWSWFLFISYFFTSFYIYALSHNFVFIGKISLLCVFFLSVASHGLLISSIHLMFSEHQVYLDNNPASRFYIFGCGCFSTGLVIKLLIKFSGGEVLSDTDNYNTLKLFNRLFISITVITLATSFLLSTFECAEVDEDKLDSKPSPSLISSTFIGYIWVFTAAYFSWSLSPMLNNLALVVLHSVKRIESFELEFYQFFTCLLLSIFIYYTDYIDMLHTERGYIYNSLHRSLCKMLKYDSFTPLSADEGHQDVREDFDKLSVTLGMRLFRDIFQWPGLPYGFWTEWEDYDNFDSNRIITLLSVFLALMNIRDQDPFNYDAYYKLGCTYMKTPQENYTELKKHKYTLLWLGCSYINKCNTTIEKMTHLLKHCATNGSCCISDIKLECCKCCSEGCKNSQSICSGDCCCSQSNTDCTTNYITNALKGCVEDCNALLYDINTIPELYDSRTVDYDEMMCALEILEELLMRLVVLLIYGRVMDEYIILCRFMKPICKKFGEGCTKFKDRCKSCQTSDQNCKDVKCCCTMYCKMIKCLCELHKRQKRSCEVMKGASFENLIETLPPLSLSRAVLLLASFFCDFMESDLLYEKATCKCATENKKCCCLADEKCCCMRFNSRVDDILNLMLQALQTLTDSDSILAHVISVLSSFSSFKYPCNYSDAIYPVDGVPECDSSGSSGNTNVLAVFGSIYGQFSDLMKSLLPPGHLKPGSGCECCINESGLCPCMRELLSIMREVCSVIDMMIKEIGSNSSSVVYLVNYQKMQKLCKRLSCCSGKLTNFSSKCLESCPGNGNCCCGSNGNDICKFVCNVCKSLSTSVKLIEALNEQNKCTIKALDTSVTSHLTKLNEKNMNLYKSCRGTRLGMLIEPSRLISKMITYYKDAIVGRVPDYMKWQFYLFFYFTFTCLILIYLGRLLPLIKNVPNKKKFKILIILYSLMVGYYFNSSFGFLSSFGSESSYYVSLAIICGILLSIVYSWLTQWFNYRMFLYEQFVELYTKFRLLFPGSRYHNSPTIFWWVEGFISFLKMDMLSMYYLLTLSKSKETYNPFNFGFSAKLNVKYDLVESEPHIFSHEECLTNIKKSVFESQYVELSNLLDYRSFYHLYETDDTFLKKPCKKPINYPIDLLYQAWTLGYTASELSNRLYHLRELGLKAIEGAIQLEAQKSNYDMRSIEKLKLYFQFQHQCLLDAPRQAVLDTQQKSPYFLNHQGKRLVKLYEQLYYGRWISFLNNKKSETTKKEESTKTGSFKDIKVKQLLIDYETWRQNRMKNCNMQFGRNDICKLAITRTGTEFETIAYELTEAKDIMSQFMDLVATSYTVKDIPPNFEVFKYLSKPIKPFENRAVKPILDKISKLIRGHSFGERSSILLDFVGVCKNIEIESDMVKQVRTHEKFLIGEWIRWQGLHISGDLVNLLLDFLLFKDT